jgi:hypothetical protein
MSKSLGRVINIGEFLERVDTIRNEFDFQEDDSWGPWFRGQERAYWGLCPKLYREHGGYEAVKRDRIEDEIREEFIVRAPVLSESKPAGKDDWEWYFLMQHFGAPTRLLDWTEGALLALYFALRNNPGLYDAAVWVLDPYRLNKKAIGKEEVIPPSATGVHPDDKKLVQPWLPDRFKNMAGLPKGPVAVFPTHIARRISTQRSCFTVHGTDDDGLDKLRDKGGLVRVVIPSFGISAMRRELESCGIDETTIFPDLEGLSRSLSIKWKSSMPTMPHAHVYTRLRPSRSHRGGVGVFAIRKIPKNTVLFSGDNEEMLWVSEASLPSGPKEIRKLYQDFCVIKGQRYGGPQNFNRLTMGGT